MNHWLWFRDQVLLREGSTRSAALMRIGLVFLLWSRFGNEIILVRSADPDRIALGAAFFITTLMYLIGWRTQSWGYLLASVLVVMFYGYGQLWGITSWASHHVALMVLGSIVLAMLPTGGSYSVDRWLAVRRARQRGEPVPAERGPVWALPLLALLLSSVYLWSAVDKTHLGFLSGQRLEMIFVDKFFGSDYPPFPGFRTFCAVQAVGVTLLQYALAFGLFFRRSRPVLMLAGIFMHLVFYYVLPVTVFSATMILFYLAFFDPDQVHRFIDELQAGPDAGDEAARRSA